MLQLDALGTLRNVVELRVGGSAYLPWLLITTGVNKKGDGIWR